jgi:hypothetical protein
MFNNCYYRKCALIFCLFLSSCASGQQTYNLATPTIMPRSTVTFQSLPSPISPVPETTAMTSMELLENPELRDIVFNSCLTIQPEPPGENEFPWVLLIGQGTIPYAVDPNTGVRTEQLLVDPGQDGISSLGNGFAVSPDGKWLAHAHYGECDTSFFVEPSTNLLTKSSRERIIWHPSQLSQLEGWLSNETFCS